jgi:hypothetical protein
MRLNKVMGSLFIAALGVGIANAAVVEEIKASAEGAKKFTVAPKIIDMDGEKVFAIPPKSYIAYALKKKTKFDPAVKYNVSVKVKQLGKVPALVYIGFIPYDAKGRKIGPQHGYNNTKGSFTTLAAAVAKGAKSLSVKDASKWKKGPYYFVAFNAKEDMSDIPNFNVAGVITRIEKNGDGYTITFSKALEKAYPAGTKVRQHRSGGTYVYTKAGKSSKEWTVWKGKPVQGKTFRKATHIRPMITINAKKEGSGAVFTDFIVEEL